MRLIPVRGEVARAIDAIGRENLFAFDDAGRLTQQVQRRGGPDVTSRLTYNPQGQLAQTTVSGPGLGGGQTLTTNYEYGTETGESEIATGDLLREVLTQATRVRLAYNAAGQVIRREDASGRRHLYEFDKLGRLVEDWAEGFGQGRAQKMKFEYDDFGNLDNAITFDATGREIDRVRRIFNSRGQVLREMQGHYGANRAPFPAVEYGYAGGSGNSVALSAMLYPGKTKSDPQRLLRYQYGGSAALNSLS